MWYCLLNVIICICSSVFLWLYNRVFFLSKTIPKIKIRLIGRSRSFGLFRKGKTHIIAKFHRTDLVIFSHSREGNPHLIAK